MPEQVPNLCPDCGLPLKALGKRWCGKKYLTQYVCRGKKGLGCGRFTFYPVHQFQHSLTSSALRTSVLEAATKNTQNK